MRHRGLPDQHPLHLHAQNDGDEDEQQAMFDQFKATTDLSTEPVTAAVPGQQNGNGNGNGARATIRDGEEPPFDFEAT